MFFSISVLFYYNLGIRQLKIQSSTKKLFIFCYTLKKSQEIFLSLKYRSFFSWTVKISISPCLISILFFSTTAICEGSQGLHFTYYNMQHPNKLKTSFIVIKMCLWRRNQQHPSELASTYGAYDREAVMWIK